MFTCPACGVRLARADTGCGIHWQCPNGHGRAVALALVRRRARDPFARELWIHARESGADGRRSCPSCEALMAEVDVALDPDSDAAGSLRLDVCVRCQFVWFDATEFELVPERPPAAATVRELPPKAREALAMLEIERIRARAEREDDGVDAPDEWWQVVPAFFGMPVEQGMNPPSRMPWVTWSTAAVIALVSVVAMLTDLEAAVEAFGFVPAEPFRLGGLTVLTSFLLHGGVFHLVSNLYFFLVFGDNVEDACGRRQFILMLLAATVTGALTHALFTTRPTMACIGASGGISGVLVFYSLTFPHARLGMLIRMYWYFRWVRVPAAFWIAFWIATQSLGVYLQLAGYSNVSALAHLGGAAVGVVFRVCGGFRTDAEREA